MKRQLSCLLSLLWLAGCASVPTAPNQVRIEMQARAQINPDGDGRPSPVEVRLYELKTSDRFEQATFHQLFLNPEQALADSASRQMQLYIRPGETLKLATELQPGSRHLGLLVGFMDIQHSRWRALADLADGDDISITLDANAVELTVHPKLTLGPLQQLITPLWSVLSGQMLAKAAPALSGSPP